MRNEQEPGQPRGGVGAVGALAFAVGASSRCRHRCRGRRHGAPPHPLRLPRQGRPAVQRKEPLPRVDEEQRPRHGRRARGRGRGPRGGGRRGRGRGGAGAAAAVAAAAVAAVAFAVCFRTVFPRRREGPVRQLERCRDPLVRGRGEETFCIERRRRGKERGRRGVSVEVEVEAGTERVEVEEKRKSFIRFYRICRGAPLKASTRPAWRHQEQPRTRGRRRSDWKDSRVGERARESE